MINEKMHLVKVCESAQYFNTFYTDLKDLSTFCGNDNLIN